MRFDGAQVPARATVTRATLRVYSNVSLNGSLVVHPQTNAWVESTATLANTPGWDPTQLATSTRLTKGAYATAVLPVSTVALGGTFSVGLSTTAGLQASLASREAVNRPQLVVEYSTTTADPTPTLGPPPPPPPSPPPPVAPVATVETAPLPAGGTFDGGDISDDSAIWADPADPSRSVVVGDSKDPATGGIAVYDLSGAVLQFRPDGRIGNVDVRTDFPLGGRSAVLIGADNRSNDTLTFWELDPVTRTLSIVGAGTTTMPGNYGFCLYRSPATGAVSAFVTATSGVVEQYQLSGETGQVVATEVRTFDVGGQTEGCVADDGLGRVYFGEEDIGIWRYDAEPSGGSTRVSVDRTGAGRLAADVEGLTIAYGPGGTGYLFASSQGDSTVVMYDRVSGAFVRKFNVGGSGTVDAVTSTDGIDVTTRSAGPGFEAGLLVVHDQTNTGAVNSNLKYVPLAQLLP